MDFREFKASLIYLVCSGLARNTQWDPVSKKDVGLELLVCALKLAAQMCEGDDVIK